jgi:hypothetical protein
MGEGDDEYIVDDEYIGIVRNEVKNPFVMGIFMGRLAKLANLFLKNN